MTEESLTSVPSPQSESFSLMRISTTSSLSRSSLSTNINTKEAHIQRVKRIRERRGVFSSIPVFCSTDLEHGSWWFVFGSILFTIIPILSLLHLDSEGRKHSISIAPHYLYITSGVLFTLGSISFVRATKHPLPPRLRIIHSFYHLQNDELLSGWLFFMASLPYIPYTIIYVYMQVGSPMNWLGLAGSLLASIVFLLFLRSCYPNQSFKESSFFPWLLQRFCCSFGERLSRLRHLENDWIASCWVLLLGSVIFTLGFLFMLIVTARRHDRLMTLIYLLDLIDWIMFTVGCAYFVAGSYSIPSPLSSAPPPNSASSSQVDASLSTSKGPQDMETIGDNRIISLLDSNSSSINSTFSFDNSVQSPLTC